jgi:hypothetical protein
MVDPLADRIISRIDQAPEWYHRLIIVVAPRGTGKTTVLHEVQERTQAPLININLELSQRLLDLTERQRVLQLPRLLGEIISAPSADVILLDNIELLFDVALKQDPLRLLQRLSRNTTLVVAWNGLHEGNCLIYAAPDHPEYRRYPLQDVVVVSPVQSGIPNEN